MKLLYTHPNPIIVANVKNILENSGFVIFLKNENLMAAAGELSPIDAWPEIWLVDDHEFDNASQLIAPLCKSGSEQTTDPVQAKRDWICPNCGEENGAAFEVCWHCHHDNNKEQSKEFSH
ncbi:MAG: hypothetical protein CMI03_13000 [Oceanospirillaceae bacterium]|uniref:putative signal transducing protein n=1 Tax=unclassified Thalassolituus TaxID=2624967 RepID=UPI000C53C20D|nr:MULTISPECIES: DUF2007 domain-containing protein [unclassified Thalassolituus]MAS23933.1 hypothetical protein [Oceanospirillaceae bacterium]MBL34935.1 hypothetical protein [Oceanospirillaceae bacterium]MBS52394.1 hypothetical protein [Oceanospirillaceae bacterium]MBS53655.1 hypothetical protein [Oceanospirillaceae bacterium]